jgi:hypothetical protein
VAAQSRSLITNGSFEQGAQSPDEWQLMPGGSWASGSSHHGTRHLHGDSTPEAMVCEGPLLGLEPGVDYRLAGWLRSPAGWARLELELDDDTGTVRQVAAAPAVTAAADWRYVAVEFRALWPAGRVRFWTRGAADLDDVILVPIACSCIGNPGAAADDRGRIPFWSAEKNGDLRPGMLRGDHQSDPGVRHHEEPSQRLTPKGDWYGLSSVNYPVPLWTDRLELSAWARADLAATAEILACWQDDLQRVLRVDRSQPVRGPIWQRMTVAPAAPPAGAATLRLVAAALGGPAWFHHFDLRLGRPTRPNIQVFVNQVGYDVAGPKSLVVATNFFPTESTTIPCVLVGPNGQAMWSREVPCAGRICGDQPDDWGWYFWRVDFSELRRTGTFRARIAASGVQAESFPVHVARGVLLGRTAQSGVDFFFAQRCGFAVPGWHAACHLDDARLNDGSHLDATGGWHSAGDYNKPVWIFGDSAVVFALARAYERHPRVFQAHDRDGDGVADALDEARFGAAFLAKMQEPGTGQLRGDVVQGPGRTWMRWLAPDRHTDNVIGTADDPVIVAGHGNAPLAIAGWALVGRQLPDQALRKAYWSGARRLWDALAVADSAPKNPLLLVSAIELHRVTADAQLRAFARTSCERLLAAQRPDGGFPGDTGDHGDITAAALAWFALAFPDDPLCQRVRGALDRYLAFCLARTDNPFGLSRQGIGGQDAEAAFFHPTVSLGVNFWLLSRAWAALLIHELSGDARALAFAADQIDWILGKNPLSLCMFEGLGRHNPPRYHHRYNMIAGHERGAVPGAIPNGFVRDMGLADRPGFDLSRGGSRSPSFRTSEPWLVHNVFYLLAVSQWEDALKRRGGVDGSADTVGQ